MQSEIEGQKKFKAKPAAEDFAMRCASLFDFREGMLHGAQTMTAEEERTRLIGEIARVLRDDPVPDDARAAALTLIGWLARRMPGEAVSTVGVNEMVRRSPPPSSGRLRRVR